MEETNDNDNDNNNNNNNNSNNDEGTGDSLLQMTMIDDQVVPPPPPPPPAEDETATAGTTAAATTAKSSSTYSYYAIRKGRGLEGPAIFCSWDDAKQYVETSTRSSNDNEENTSAVIVYQSFTTFDDAVEYLKGDGVGSGEPSSGKKRKATRTTPTSSIIMQQQKKARVIRTVSSLIRRPLPGKIKQSEFDKMYVKLQLFKDEYQHVNVPGPYSKKVIIDTQKYGTLREWMKMIREAVKQYKDDPRYSPLTNQQMVQLADIGLISRSVVASIETSNSTNKKTSSKKSLSATYPAAAAAAADNNSSLAAETRWKTPTSAHNLMKMKKQLEDMWDDRIKLLREYKEERGHCAVPRRPNKTLGDKYTPLCKFAGWMHVLLQEYKESKDSTHFFLNEERAQQLEELGFTCTTPEKRVNARELDADVGTFDEMLQDYKRLKDVNAPVKTNRKLEWWITEQRKQYALFKANRPSTITPDKVAQMAAVDFPFEKMKSPSWDERAVEWLEFKTKTGRDPMREEALYQWVYKQRCKYKQRKEGNKNNLTDEQIQYVFCV
jgi:hypothetical protein